jgi:hypothetical protein
VASTQILVVSGTACLVSFAYLWDISYWYAWLAPARFAVRMSMMLGFAAVAVVSFKDYPAFPIGLFLLMVPVMFKFIYSRFYAKTAHVSWYVSSLATAVFIAGCLGLGTWVGWVLLEKKVWNTSLRDQYKIELDCPEDEEYCLAAFLLWSGHLIASCMTIVFSAILLFMSYSLERMEETKRMHPAVKLFSLTTLLAMIGVWVAAEIGGAATRMADLVTTYSLVGGSTMIVLVGSLFGWRALWDELQMVPAIRKLCGYITSDWTKAIGAMIFSIPFLIYLFLSIFNNVIRKNLNCCVSKHKATEASGLKINADGVHDGAGYEFKLVTEKASVNLTRVINWNRTSVLVKCIQLGLIFVLFSVGIGKMTTIFLSWLNAKLAPLQLGVVLGVFVLVGLSMFLLPPVPGVPVYLTGGVLLVESAWNTWVPPALALALFVLLFLHPTPSGL